MRTLVVLLVLGGVGFVFFAWATSGPETVIKSEEGDKTEPKRPARKAGDERRGARLARWDAACRELVEELGKNGLSCPHCLHESKEARFVDQSPRGKSYFVCRPNSSRTPVSCPAGS